MVYLGIIKNCVDIVSNSELRGVKTELNLIYTNKYYLIKTAARSIEEIYITTLWMFSLQYMYIHILFNT